MLSSAFEATYVRETSETRVAGFGVFVKGCGRRRSALEILGYRLDGVSNLTANRKLFWLRVAVHAVTFASVRAANSREITVLVLVTLLHVPETFGEWIFWAFAWDSKKRCNEFCENGEKNEIISTITFVFDVFQWFFERFMTSLTSKQLAASETLSNLLTILVLIANYWEQLEFRFTLARAK